MPGIVLASVETAEASRRSVILGVSKQGFSTPSGGAVRVLAILIDPPGRRGDGHLDVLAAITRVFRSSAFVEPERVDGEAPPAAAREPDGPGSRTPADVPADETART
jgi:hypothetical protein